MPSQGPRQRLRESSSLHDFVEINGESENEMRDDYTVILEEEIENACLGFIGLAIIYESTGVRA